ncbi:MAG: hypothetical protein H3C43_05715 [Leptonema sp. (in: Bacteria)]|nr:hypothetical protein [Leptonema sp. (in: bacteria)]
MKQLLTNLSLLQGKAKQLELNVNELEQVSSNSVLAHQELRVEAIDLKSNQKSFYINRRLDAILSILDQIDQSQLEQAKLYRSLIRYLHRLQNSDLVDHFGRGVEHRLQKILVKQNPKAKQIIQTNRIYGYKWFKLTIGTMSVAIQGRLIRYQNVDSKKKIEPGPFKLVVFPQTEKLIPKENFWLAIFKTESMKRAAIYCNQIQVLPTLFKPENLKPVPHSNLLMKMKYKSETLFVWKDSITENHELGRTN